MRIGEIYVPLVVGFPDDPKVSALARFGYPDAGLARDLYVQMILYCRRALTDGLVPAEELGRLAYPASADEAARIAKHLADVGLCTTLCDPHCGLHCTLQCERHARWYAVLAYTKRNGTARDAAERSAQSRQAAMQRWSDHADRTAGGSADRSADRTASGMRTAMRKHEGRIDSAMRKDAGPHNAAGQSGAHAHRNADRNAITEAVTEAEADGTGRQVPEPPF